jgi:hypothetical protein
LRNKLLEINQENGYSTNIKNVILSRKIPDKPPSTDTVQIIPLESTEDVWCSGHTYENLNIELWFYKQRLQNQDQEFNTFLADLRNCLKFPFCDPTHPNPAATGIYMEKISTVPLYNTPADDTVVGIIRYRMQFHYDFNNENRWDETDVPLEIDE